MIFNLSEASKQTYTTHLGNKVFVGNKGMKFVILEEWTNNPTPWDWPLSRQLAVDLDHEEIMDAWW